MYNQKLNVFLDLDNTLIHSVDLSLAKTSKYTELNTTLEYRDFVFNSSESSSRVPRESGGYRIYKRPGLDPFLDYLFKHCNVSVFTHADKEYAQFICKNIVAPITHPERKLEFIFCRIHVNLGLKIYGTPDYKIGIMDLSRGYKDLRLIWNVFRIFGMNKCNTVIIDDHPQVLQSNPRNTIPIKPFSVHYPDFEKDTELKSVLEEVKIRGRNIRKPCTF